MSHHGKKTCSFQTRARNMQLQTIHILQHPYRKTVQRYPHLACCLLRCHCIADLWWLEVFNISACLNYYYWRMLWFLLLDLASLQDVCAGKWNHSKCGGGGAGSRHMQKCAVPCIPTIPGGQQRCSISVHRLLEKYVYSLLLYRLGIRDFLHCGYRVTSNM